MKEKYSKFFNGLNDNEKTAKKEDLIKSLQDAQGLHDVDCAENGWHAAVMKREGKLMKQKVRRLSWCYCMLIIIWLFNHQALYWQNISNIAIMSFLINEDFTDGPTVSQNCTITGLPELKNALDSYKDKILSELYSVMQMAKYIDFSHLFCS
jgi:hypothetical protein